MNRLQRINKFLRIVHVLLAIVVTFMFFKGLKMFFLLMKGG
jgi:cytochrome b subunit of formate dehydrogenase